MIDPIENVARLVESVAGSLPRLILIGEGNRRARGRAERLLDRLTVKGTSPRVRWERRVQKRVECRCGH
jgi:hypothetical protein